MTVEFRSLNQIQQTARKAARAAGLSWGLADEAGDAVMWLQLYKFNPCGILIDALNNISRTAAPQNLNGVWIGDGDLNPFITGAAICDVRARLINGIECGAVAYPLLVAGFVGGLATAERAIKMKWGGGEIICTTAGVVVSGDEFLYQARSNFLSVRVGDFDFERQNLRAGKYGETEIDITVWQRLEKMAAATYVAASEISRGGAGGLTDND